MERNYTYDAFISYRHCDLDQFVAENLHKQLETYKLPARIAKKDSMTKYKIERVFRDKEELPIATNLEDPIVDALKESEYLLVICTPRIKESIWCRKEIETFINLHGRERILAILAEGEPADSFPEELLYRDKEVTNPDGTVSIIREAIEPLGADVRGNDKKEVLKAIKTELPRILAPIFGTSYDGLKQRHRERRMKRIMAAAMITAAVGVTFGTVSTIMATKIQHQKAQIEEQNGEILAKNDEIIKQNDEIKAQAEEIKNQNDSLLLYKAEGMADEALRMLGKGDRIGAIRVATGALTKYDGIQMPYTEEAVYALTTAVRAYDRGNKIVPIYQTQFAGTIDWIEAKYKAPKVLVKDSVDHIYVVNVRNGQIEYAIEDAISYKKTSAAFVSDTDVAYLSADNKLRLVNIESGSAEELVAPAWSDILQVEYDWNVMAVCSDSNIIFYDMNTKQEISRVVQEQYSIFGQGYFGESIGEKYYVLNVSEKTNEEAEFIAKINIATGEIAYIPAPDRMVNDVKFTENAMVVLSSNYRNNYMDCDMYLTAYAYGDNRVVWETKVENTSGYMLGYETQNPEQAIVMAGWSVMVADLKNGNITDTYAIGDETVFALPAADGHIYALFTRDGKRKVLGLDDRSLMETVGSFVSHTENLKQMIQVQGGLMAAGYKENAITYYSLLDYENPVDNVILEAPQTENYTFSDAKKYAEEKQLLYPDIVNFVFLSEDSKLTFASYGDDSFRIYNTADGTLLQELTAGTGIRYFYGTDSEGGYIVGSYNEAFKFSNNNKLLAYIPNFAGFNPEKNKIYLTEYGQMYEYPNLTVQELLDMAETVVLQYTETN